jgi:serine/threonine protein kinase
MDTIGRYRLVRRLGAGSFATVWLGHDDDLDVPVAVKVLAENWAGNADVRHRFLGEARILRRIRDPRIVAVYDIGTLPDGRPYFVMDFVNGGSLDDLRKSRVPPAFALRLCAQACRAIDVLHAHHVLHRDVTPGNLLIQRAPGGTSHVVLADLGVAKAMAESNEMTMTAGTPAYMAPEQAAGGSLDRRVDVYSLSAVSYAMLTGQPPFQVRTVADIVNRDPGLDPPLLAARLGAPPSLDTVLSAGLAFRVDRRPPTAAILADALDVVAAEMEPDLGAVGPQADASTVLIPPELRTQPPRPPVTSTTNPPVRSPSITSPPVTSPGIARSPSTRSATPQPSGAVPPNDAHVSTGGWPPPTPKRRSRVAFAALVVVASAALFALSMYITILVLRR